MRDYFKEPINVININNSEYLDLLNNFLWFVKHDDLEKVIPLDSRDKNRDDYISDQYLKTIMDMGEGHDGFPEFARAHSIKNGYDHYIRKQGQTGPELEQFAMKFDEVNFDLQTRIAAKNCALATIYPPGGFISWHNNANASAYNIIFSWSETGDGWFDYIHPETGERIHLPDKPGWNCKAGYFGAYRDGPSKLCYHAASTECWRMSVAYVFSRDEIENSKFMWNMLMEELEAEVD